MGTNRPPSETSVAASDGAADAADTAGAGTLRVVRPGQVPYGRALAWQREAAARLRAGEGPETLFLLTHPPVVTLGRRATANHVLLSAAELAARGVDLVETDRGGDVTFHGPGQVVGYPILDLRRRGLGAHTYLRFLEGLLAEVLAGFGIEAFRDPAYTGVWTREGKIAAMGIRVSGGISLHGFALNVATDLDFFGLIVPCGIRGRRVTSMQEALGRAVDIESVMDRIEAAFRTSSAVSSAASSRSPPPAPAPERLA